MLGFRGEGGESLTSMISLCANHKAKRSGYYVFGPPARLGQSREIREALDNVLHPIVGNFNKDVPSDQHGAPQDSLPFLILVYVHVGAWDADETLTVLFSQCPQGPNCQPAHIGDVSSAVILNSRYLRGPGQEAEDAWGYPTAEVGFCIQRPPYPSVNPHVGFELSRLQ